MRVGGAWDLAGATGATLSTHLTRLGADGALDLNTLNNWLTIMFASAVECGRVDLVDELLEIGIAHPVAGPAEGRARVLSRWGEACIQGGAASRFLDAIGREQPRCSRI